MASRSARLEILLEDYLIREFLPSRKTLGRAPRTIQNYRQDIQNHIIPALGEVRLADLSVNALQQFVLDLRLEKGLDPKYIRNIVGCLSTALNWATKMGLVHRNEALLVDLPRPNKSEEREKYERKRAMAWSRQELKHFFRIAPRTHELTRWAVIGATTGMRPGEQCARRWEDWRADCLEIDASVYESDVQDRRKDKKLPRYLIGDVKTGEGRAIRMTAECIEAQQEQRRYVMALVACGALTSEAAEFVFPNHGGPQPFTNPARVYERWRYFIKGDKNGGRRASTREALTGVRFITLYGLRHTHATDLLAQGQSMKFVAERLGTSVAMVERHYGHILREIEAEAIGNLPALGYTSVSYP